MARLILIRHGESVANAEGRFTRGPHEPLSRRGREEALARARRIQARFDPVALYASPFVRALETARLIGGVLGLEPIAVEELREQDFGSLRGQPYASLRGERQTDRWRFRPRAARRSRRCSRAWDRPSTRSRSAISVSRCWS